MDEILKCDHSNESYWAVLSCGAVYNMLWKIVQGTFLSLWMKSQSATIQMKATEQHFPVVLFIMLWKIVQCTFLSLWMKSQSATIQMKATEQHFPVVLFIMLWKIVQGTFLSLWMKSQSVIIQMKATEQYFPVVLFIILYKVILAFESVYEILKCDHSNKSYWAVLSCGTVYYAVRGDSNFLSLRLKS